jgi:hypothetical protein
VTGASEDLSLFSAISRENLRTSLKNTLCRIEREQQEYPSYALDELKRCILVHLDDLNTRGARLGAAVDHHR